MLHVDIRGGLFTAQVQLAQAPQRSARLPQLQPHHPTGYYGGDPYYRRGALGARAAYCCGAPYAASANDGHPWYAVRAYYQDGPWYGYSGWDDYAARNAIGCTPGTLVKGKKTA